MVNKNGEILCVSRKDDLNDFGLPGGKIEKDDLKDVVGLIEGATEKSLDLLTKEINEYLEEDKIKEEEEKKKEKEKKDQDLKDQIGNQQMKKSRKKELLN